MLYTEYPIMKNTALICQQLQEDVIQDDNLIKVCKYSLMLSKTP